MPFLPAKEAKIGQLSELSQEWHAKQPGKIPEYRKLTPYAGKGVDTGMPVGVFSWRQVPDMEFAEQCFSRLSGWQILFRNIQNVSPTNAPGFVEAVIKIDLQAADRAAAIMENF